MPFAASRCRRSRRPVRVERIRALLGVVCQIADNLIGIGGQCLSQVFQFLVGVAAEEQPEELQHDHYAGDYPGYSIAMPLECGNGD